MMLKALPMKWVVFVTQLTLILLIIVVTLRWSTGNGLLEYSALPSPLISANEISSNENLIFGNTSSPKTYNKSITLWNLPKSFLPFTETGESKFLPEYKNPCWYRDQDQQLYCLPYFYLLGVAKSGTTRLYMSLTEHPQIESAKKKEFYFWNSPLKYQNFPHYLSNFGKATQNIRQSVTTQGTHSKITVEGSPSYFVLNTHMTSVPGNLQPSSNEPLYTLAHTLYTVNPRTKLIVSLRNPTNRLFSHYHHIHEHGFSPADFHKNVVIALRMMEECLRKRSLRSCAYDAKFNFHMQEQNWIVLHYSMYSVYAREWLSVFPRDQIMFIKAEEFYANATKVLKDAYNFLGVGDTPQAVYNKIESDLKKFKDPNLEKIAYRSLMFNETRVLLDDFFKPYNQDLATLLGDDKWLFGAEPATMVDIDP